MTSVVKLPLVIKIPRVNTGLISITKKDVRNYVTSPNPNFELIVILILN